jgi:hypothetical protein
MSAQDNLSKQLFHGTGSDLKPGDIIRPAQGRPQYPGDNWKQDVYATHDIETARHYARARGAAGVTVDEQGSWKHKAPAMFGSVYEVEPLKGDTTLQSGHHATSSRGFRVKGLHSLVTSDAVQPTDLNLTPVHKSKEDYDKQFKKPGKA